MRSFLAQHFGPRSHERSFFSKKLVFAKSDRSKMSKNVKIDMKWVQDGDDGLRFGLYGQRMIELTVLKHSLALGRQFLTKNYQNGPKTDKQKKSIYLSLSNSRSTALGGPYFSKSANFATPHLYWPPAGWVRARLGSQARPGQGPGPKPGPAWACMGPGPARPRIYGICE